MTERRRVQTEQGQLEYELTRKRVKNYNLRVRPDGTLAVSVPTRTPLKQADDFVRRKARWIEAARRRLAGRREQASPAYALLLGRRIPLTVEQGARPCILVAADGVRLRCTEGTEAALLDAYRLRWAAPVFAAAMERAQARFAGVALPPVQCMAVRTMKSRWGSCIPAKGKITLNAHLMKKPFGCIEYVAVHELCHLLVPDHGPDFYRLLGRVMPDYAQRRAQLNRPDAGI